MAERDLLPVETGFRAFFNSMKDMLRQGLDEKYGEINYVERHLARYRLNETEDKRNLSQLSKKAQKLRALLNSVYRFEEIIEDILYPPKKLPEQEEVCEVSELQVSKHEIQSNSKGMMKSARVPSSRGFTEQKRPSEKNTKSTQVRQKPGNSNFKRK